MVAIAATVVSIGVVAALCLLLLKFAVAVRDYRKTCYFMRQFPHVKGSIFFGNLFEVMYLKLDMGNEGGYCVHV